MKINNLNDFITPKQAFGKLPDITDMSSYESPIRMIVGEMETKMEADTMSVIQRYGIDVDKDELIKALNYDRGQYEKGYADRGNMIVPVTLETDQSGTVRQIKGYLDKATQMIYVTLMSVECVEMIGWKIKEGEEE
jgi:hypothetical protein